jgi:hypothetical protein
MTFLPEEAINDPKALHNVFVEMRQAYAQEKVAMSNYQSEMLIKIMLAEDAGIYGIFNDLSKTFPIGGFFKRMDILPIKFEKRLLVSLGAIYTDFGIGGLILIGYYLQWLAALAGKTIITTDWVYSDVWPFGIFSKETIHKFWDKQKVKAKPDNLVDHATAASSFLASMSTTA